MESIIKSIARFVILLPAEYIKSKRRMIIHHDKMTWVDIGFVIMVTTARMEPISLGRCGFYIRAYPKKHCLGDIGELLNKSNPWNDGLKLDVYGT